MLNLIRERERDQAGMPWKAVLLFAIIFLSAMFMLVI